MTLLNELNVGGQQYGMMGAVPMGTCATPAGTAIKESAFADDFELSAGNLISVTFTYANTYGDGSTTYPSLKIGSYTYPIKYPTGAYAASGAWANGQAVTFMFDGTNLIMTHPVATAVQTENNLPVSSAAVAKAIDQVIYDTSITDCDNAFEKGKIKTYWLDNMAPNVPNANNSWYVISECNSGSVSVNNYITQIATSADNTSTNEMYIRHKTISSWTSWQKVLNNSDLTSSVTSGSSAPITSGGVHTAISSFKNFYYFSFAGQPQRFEICRFNISSGGVAGTSFLIGLFQTSVNTISSPMNFGCINISSGANASGFSLNGFLSIPLDSSYIGFRVYKTSTEYILYLYSTYAYTNFTMLNMHQQGGVSYSYSFVNSYEGTKIYDSATDTNIKIISQLT